MVEGRTQELFHTKTFRDDNSYTSYNQLHGYVMRTFFHLHPTTVTHQ